MSDQDDSLHKAIIQDERRKFESAKAVTEAMKQNVEKIIAAAMKDENVKKNLGRDGAEIMKSSRAGSNDIRDTLGSKGNDEQFGGEVGAEFTGIYEDKPWLKE